MSKFKTALTLLRTPFKMVMPLGNLGLLNILPDQVYLKLLYKGAMGKKLNLNSPKSFNEKLQWLKMHDHNEQYISLVDKLAAKQYVADNIGIEYVVPTLAVWDKAQDISADSMPDKFVIKCNHDQGSCRIVSRESSQDLDSLKKFYHRKLLHNPYPQTREWPYSAIKPLVFAEPYLAENLIDYKFFCFNGQPRFINIGMKDVNNDRTQVTFVNENWEYMPFQRTDYPRVLNLPPKPMKMQEMLNVARILSAGNRFARIDLYNIGERILFSEFTLYPTSGLIQFDPPEYDEIIGSWLAL